MEIMLLKASATTNPNKLAWSLVRNIQEGKIVEIAAVGAGAINQVVKALAIGRSLIASSGKDLSFKVGFMDVELEGVMKTGVKFFIIVS